MTKFDEYAILLNVSVFSHSEVSGFIFSQKFTLWSEKIGQKVKKKEDREEMNSKDMKNKRVFITGATGFVGAHITKHLIELGANVTVLIERCDSTSYFSICGLDKKVNIYYGDISNGALIEQILVEQKIEFIFHLAAVALQDLAYKMPKVTFQVNIVGTYNILDAARLHMDTVKAVLVASSDKVYGDSDVLPYNESMILQGSNPYDVSKVCQDMLARSFYHSYKLPVAVGRFGNIYGPGDNNFNRLIPGTIQKLENGESPVIRHPANGVFKRDFLYIKDIVNAYMYMLYNIEKEGVVGNAFNFGTGIATDIETIVNKIKAVMNCENIESVIQQSDVNEILIQQLDPTKAFERIGWKAEYSVDMGLAETVDWYRNVYFKLN